MGVKLTALHVFRYLAPEVGFGGVFSVFRVSKELLLR
jgi:hypothetical protein